MKFCGNCGHELSGNGRFCPSCGAPVEHMEETAAAMQYVQTRPPQKVNFSKKWVIITIAALVLIGGGSALGMFFFNKTPKELFLVSEYNSYQQMTEDWDSMYGEDFAFQEKLQKQPSSSQIKLSGNVNIDDGSMGYQDEQILDLLKDSSITIKTSQDPLKKLNHSNIALNIDGSKALGVEYVQSKNQAGIKIPELFDEFFYLNFDEYGDFMRMVNPYYEGPERLELNSLSWNELKLTEKEKEKLKQRYSGFLLQEMKEENFTLKKGVKFDHDGQTLKLREITFKLSPAETREFLNSFMNQLIEDDDLQNIIADRYVTLTEAQAVTNQSLPFQNKAELKRDIKSGLKDLKKDMNDSNYPEGFKYVILIDNDEQIINRQVVLTVGEQNDFGTITFETKNVPVNKNKRFEEISFEVTPMDRKDGKLAFNFTNTISAETDKRKEDLKAVFAFEEHGNLESKVDFSMNSLFRGKSAKKQTIERDLKLRLGGDEFSGVPVFKGTIYQNKDVSVKDKYSNQKFDIKVNVQDRNSPGTISLAVDAKTQLKDKIEVPRIGNKGSNVVDLTEDDLNEIFNEMEYNLQDLFSSYGQADF